MCLDILSLMERIGTSRKGLEEKERKGTKLPFYLFGKLIKGWNRNLLTVFGSYIIKE